MGPPLQLRYSICYSSVTDPLYLRYNSETSLTAPLPLPCTSVTAPLQLPLQLRYSSDALPLQLRDSSVTAPLHLRYSASVAAPLQIPLQLRYSSVAPPLQLRYNFRYSSVIQLRYSCVAGTRYLLRLHCSFSYSIATAGSARLQPSDTAPLQLRSFPLQFLLQAPLPASISAIVKACK